MFHVPNLDKYINQNLTKGQRKIDKYAIIIGQIYILHSLIEVKKFIKTNISSIVFSKTHLLKCIRRFME